MKPYHYNFWDLVKFFETKLYGFSTEVHFATAKTTHSPYDGHSSYSHVYFELGSSNRDKAVKMAKFVFKCIPTNRHNTIIQYMFLNWELPEYIY